MTAEGQSADVVIKSAVGVLRTISSYANEKSTMVSKGQLTFADDRGEELFVNTYSESLHYSENVVIVHNPSHCCTIS